MEVIGIGLANIDLIAHVSDAFLTARKVRKGQACKFDDLSFARLRADLEQYDAAPGGCAANTLCGLATLGVQTQFFGKIGADSFESLFSASFNDYGVTYEVAAGRQESSQCAVLVTPDGERSFAYSHGASWDLGTEDIDPHVLENAVMICTEIYLFEFGKDANLARMVFRAAEAHKIPLVMKVMDRDFGRKYAQKIKSLAEAGILSLLVGNHENLPSVVGGHDVEETLHNLKTWPCPVLLTANKDGAHYAADGTVLHFKAETIENPKNTAGAGDQFLAGFLAGWLDKKPVAECMAFAAAQARQMLMHDTARPPMGGRRAIRF